MSVMARACGHHELSSLQKEDLATYHHDMARLAGVSYAGYR